MIITLLVVPLAAFLIVAGWDTDNDNDGGVADQTSGSIEDDCKFTVNHMQTKVIETIFSERGAYALSK